MICHLKTILTLLYMFLYRINQFWGVKIPTMIFSLFFILRVLLLFSEILLCFLFLPYEYFCSYTNCIPYFFKVCTRTFKCLLLWQRRWDFFLRLKDLWCNCHFMSYFLYLIINFSLRVHSGWISRKRKLTIDLITSVWVSETTWEKDRADSWKLPFDFHRHTMVLCTPCPCTIN